MTYFYRRHFCRKDSNAGEVLSKGYTVIKDFYSADFIEKAQQSLSHHEKWIIEPQSPTVRSIHKHEEDSIFNFFFKDKRLDKIVSEITGSKIENVRNWAQIREGQGFSGAFDEFFHHDSYKHRIKAFLLLSDIEEYEGSLEFAPKSDRGWWRLKLSHQLYDIEKRNKTNWGKEQEAYEIISSELDNQYAGCFTFYQSSKIFKKKMISPISIKGNVGDIILWDSRYLHRHVAKSSGQRLMLERVWSKFGNYG